MLRATSIALQVIAGLALICALGIRARHSATTPEAKTNGGLFRFADWTMTAYAGDWDLPEHDEETVRKTFTLTGADRSLEIDNVSGAIEVVGTDGDQVQVVVNEKYRAESKEKLAEARKRITLETTQDGSSLRLYVDGPSRWQDGFWGFGDGRGYCGSMDFQVQVPRETRLTLKTVDGSVHVRDVHGDFSVHSVSGAITMEGLTGSGSARTVNGAVRVKFRENPRQSSDFGSVNGSVDLYFAPKLNADFRLQTFNGSVFSDFAMEAPSAEVEHEGMKTIYRAHRDSGGRVGTGGPEIRVETLNGAIRILENHE